MIQSLHSGVQAIETALGFFFHMVITLILGMLIVLTLADLNAIRPSERAGTLWIFGSAAVLWLLVDLPSLWSNWGAAFSKDRPLAVAAALRQYRIPFLLRPIAAIWWLAHFAFGALFVLMSDEASDAINVDPQAGRALAIFLTFAYGVATNGFLIYGVGSLVRSRRVLERVWSMRILVDLGLCLLSVLLAKWGVKLITPEARSL